MRSKKILIAFGLLSMLLWSCDSDDSEDVSAPEAQLMVEAYVFADEPVNHVKIGRVHSEGAAEMIPVEDATVSITQGDKYAQLVLKDAATGVYEIPDPEFTFLGNETLQLEIFYEGKVYSASTTFPAPLESLFLTNDNIQASGGDNNTLLTTLSWTDSYPDRTYCVFSRISDSDSAAVFDIQTSDHSPLYSLSIENSVDFHADDFTHLGTYNLYVSAVNVEYTQMYYDGDSPELRGAPTNIESAWGVFTAFNGLSVEINVE